MISLGRLNEMYRMQSQLNDLTFKKNNLKYLNQGVERELTIASFNELLTFKVDRPEHVFFNEKNGPMHWWIQQYTLCAIMELQELEESKDPQNDIIEMIDIWHFIMSMLQVSGTTYDAIIEYNEDYVSRFHTEDLDAFFKSEYLSSIKVTRNDLRTYLHGVISTLPWKHWSKKSDFSYADTYAAINKCLWAWLRIALDMGIDGERLYNVYVQKNKVNIDRQMSEVYGIAPKTEDDNKAIKV